MPVKSPFNPSQKPNRNPKPLKEPLENALAKAAARAASGLHPDLALSARDLTLEIPKDPRHGDLATSLAFRIARQKGGAPLDHARRLIQALEAHVPGSVLEGRVEKMEAHAPGFVNFFLSRASLWETLAEIHKLRDRFGRSRLGLKRSVQIEFVSANPTGPLSIAHARQAAVGDSLARILEAVGYRAVREYYLNDEGNQINLLGQSILARYREHWRLPFEIPEQGYRGGYIADIAKGLAAKRGRRLLDQDPARAAAFCSDYGVRAILSGIEKELADFGVRFDHWTSQKALTRAGKIEQALEILRKKGFLFEAEGALWFRSTAFGDDKDRVIKKSDGSYTYLAPDIAYHREKFQRRYAQVINLWGPDHHGYIPRIRAAIQALGFDPAPLSVLIVQLCTLYRGGVKVQMSTRAGELATLKELLDEVGRDAARFYLLGRKVDSHLDFDLELAKKQAPENPVYYVQYAHARIASVRGFQREKGDRLRRAPLNLERLGEPEELELVKRLRQFPEILVSAAEAREPHRLLTYAIDLATGFHLFYTKHRVVGDDPELSRARLYLVEAVRIVLARSLALLGVSAPTKM